ncbi:MAG: hypothetical protein HYU66_01640 [Armatimonadetes bacterium]|nr:hypothetical protein [Armatimonadota bacterium]
MTSSEWHGDKGPHADWGWHGDTDWHGYKGWHGDRSWHASKRWYTERVFASDPGGWFVGWHEPVLVTRVVERPVVINTVQHVWYNTVYVPVREPFIQIGAVVSWWPDLYLGTVIYGTRQVIFEPYSPHVIIVEDGIWYPDYWVVAPVVYTDVLYVPVEPVAAGLGLAVNWNSATGTSVSGGFFFSAMW